MDRFSSRPAIIATACGESIDRSDERALALVATLNETHEDFGKYLSASLQFAFEAGRLLVAIKQTLPHGTYESFLKTHFRGSLATANRYSAVYKKLGTISDSQRESLLREDHTITSLLRSLPEPTKNAKSFTVSDLASPQDISDSKTPTVSYQPRHSDSVQLDDHCPNCNCTWWLPCDEGHDCDQCNHPHGEPATESTDDDALILRPTGDLEEIPLSREHEKLRQKCRSAIGVLVRGLPELGLSRFEETLQSLVEAIG